jgi:hypothetical protein
MELRVVETGGSEWTADVADIDTDMVMNAVDNGTRFIIFQGADDGTVVINLQYVKNFRLVKKENSV